MVRLQAFLCKLKTTGRTLRFEGFSGFQRYATLDHSSSGLPKLSGLHQNHPTPAAVAACRWTMLDPALDVLDLTLRSTSTPRVILRSLNTLNVLKGIPIHPTIGQCPGQAAQRNVPKSPVRPCPHMCTPPRLQQHAVRRMEVSMNHTPGRRAEPRAIGLPSVLVGVKWKPDLATRTQARTRLQKKRPKTHTHKFDLTIYHCGWWEWYTSHRWLEAT